MSCKTVPRQVGLGSVLCAVSNNSKYEVSNFFLDNENRVVLGQNIVHTVPGPSLHDVDQINQWIIEQFWIITETVR
jgi:hypothetical protein